MKERRRKHEPEGNGEATGESFEEKLNYGGVYTTGKQLIRRWKTP